MRPVGFVLVLAVVLGASARGQDAITIKTHFPAVGDKVKITVEEKTEIKVTINGAKEPKVETTTKSLVYEDEVTGVSTDRLPTKLKRHYTKAVVGTNGKDTTLKIQGKTVVIFNGFGDNFTYTVEGKGEAKLDADSVALLDNEFAHGNREKLIEVLCPAKALKLNDTWDLDSERLKLVLNDKYDTDLKVVKPTGQGTLVKLDKLPKFDPKGKDPPPKQTGAIKVILTAGVISTDKAQLKIKEGSLTITFDGDGVLDGSVPQGKSEAVSTLKATGTLEGQDVEIEMSVTEKRTMTPISKK